MGRALISPNWSTALAELLTYGDAPGAFRHRQSDECLLRWPAKQRRRPSVAINVVKRSAQAALRHWLQPDLTDVTAGVLSMAARPGNEWHGTDLV